MVTVELRRCAHGAVDVLIEGLNLKAIVHAVINPIPYLVSDPNDPATSYAATGAMNEPLKSNRLAIATNTIGRCKISDFLLRSLCPQTSQTHKADPPPSTTPLSPTPPPLRSRLLSTCCRLSRATTHLQWPSTSSSIQLHHSLPL
jgi:hypothetical protein